jgi:Flp pilus assembly protein TadG
MNRHQSPRKYRRGAIAPLTAVLLIPLLGMIAFAVDMGWITHSQNELQSAADAAALAGAAQLPGNWASYYMITQNGQTPLQQAAAQSALLTAAEKSASSYAKMYAGYNRAGGVDSLTLLDSDIEFGFTDASGNYTPAPTYTGYPNTIKVTLRRDSTANGSLGLFFARVLGMDTVDLKATAAATIYTANVNGFQTSNSAAMARILPMTYDVNHWNNFIATGQSPDGTSTTDSNGNPTLAVYPSIKFTGNFGQLSLDQGNDGASTISGWLNNGVSTSDIQQEKSAGLLPLSSHDSSLPPDWKGNPGLKESTIHTASQNVGTIYLLPLFKPVNDGSIDPSLYQAGIGLGSNYYYTIVQFVAIQIVSADDGSIIVEPVSGIYADAVLNGVMVATPPTSSSWSVATTFGACKLTQ